MQGDKMRRFMPILAFQKTCAVGAFFICAAGAYWWPWMVSYPMPEQFAHLTVIDKMPMWVGRTVAIIAAALLPWELWPRKEKS